MAADQLMWRTARRYARALLEHSAGSNTTARGAMDAAAAPGSDAEIVCSSGPWGFFCYRKPPDESTPSNTTTIIAPSDSDPAAGGPVGSTMFIVSMSMVAMLIVVSLLASYCTMRHRRRRRSRILAVAEEDRQRQQKEAEGLVREVMIPILVIGPDQSTMHVAFDELHADGDSCDGTCGSSTTCRARQAADAAELLSGTTVPAGTAAVGSEASPEAQQRQQQQQQRKWWQRAAPADPSAHAQAAGSSSHLQRNPPGGLELSSSSGGSGVPSDEHSTAASHSLVQRLRCPASRSVLSVAHAWQETGGDHPLATTGTAAAAAARSSDHHHPALTGASTGTATDGGPWTGPLP